MKKIWLFILMGLFLFGITSCEMPGVNNNNNDNPIVDPSGQSGGNIDPTQIVKDEDMVTPYTDQLKLNRSFAGKSFINDGIGEVKLYVSTDGDTAQFTEGSFNFTARFNGVDTPESTYKVEPWGKSASRFTKSKLTTAYKIVLQRDEIKTQVLDSTLKRYLAWVWYQPTADSDFRLLNLELVEQSYTTSKASGSMYAEQMMEADLKVQKLGVRVYNNTVKDPDYDYSETGKYLSIQEIRENAEEYGQSAIKVIVRGIVARKVGSYSAYIQQQADGIWYVGETCLNVKQSEETPDMPYVGENGNWWYGDVDTEIKAVNGNAGQTAYQYYAAQEETPLEELEWMQGLEHNEINGSLNYPYVYRPLEWYGIYLYGGFSGQASKLTIGYEVKVGGNFSMYAGSIQVTGVTAKGIEVLNREKQEPHIYDIQDVTTLTLENTQKFNTLVELHNLYVYGGYNTKTSDGFTLYCRDSKNNRINIRVDGNTAIHTTKDGEYITVADSTATTAKKGYYSEAKLDADGYGLVNCYQYFVGMTFESLKGIVAVYDPAVEGEESNAQVQIMLTLVSDITLKVE